MRERKLGQGGVRIGHALKEKGGGNTFFPSRRIDFVLYTEPVSREGSATSHPYVGLVRCLAKSCVLKSDR